MNLKELGEHFRIERERQGLCVEDVVMRTKISKANVRALEDGDASLLPHPVYAKGFVRNYALLLGLNPEECAEVIGREYVAEDNVSVPQPTLDGPEQAIGGESRKSGLLVLLAGLLGIVLVGGGMYYWNSLEGAGEQAVEKGAEVRVQEPEAAPVAPAQVEPQAEPQPGGQPETQPGAHQEEGAEAAPRPAPATGEQGALEPAADRDAQAAQAGQKPGADDEEMQPAPEHEAAATAGNAALAGDGRQKVLITASEACWIFAKVDGGDEAENGVVVDVVLQPGQSKLVRFQREMVMKLGNAGGVRVTLNGKDYPFEAQSGQVRTLTFSAP